MPSPRCSRPPGNLPSPNSGLLPLLLQSLGGQPPVLVLPDRSSGWGEPGFSARSDDAVTRVYDEAGNMIETHEHAGDFKRAVNLYSHSSRHPENDARSTANLNVIPLLLAKNLSQSSLALESGG
jgi:hypothetical protein